MATGLSSRRAPATTARSTEPGMPASTASAPAASSAAAVAFTPPSTRCAEVRDARRRSTTSAIVAAGTSFALPSAILSSSNSTGMPARAAVARAASMRSSGVCPTNASGQNARQSS